MITESVISVTDSLIWFQGSGLMTCSANLEIMALTKDYLVVNKVDVNGDNLVILVENFGFTCIKV